MTNFDTNGAPYDGAAYTYNYYMRDKHRGPGDIPTAVSSFCIHATVVITYVSSNGSYGCRAGNSNDERYRDRSGGL